MDEGGNWLTLLVEDNDVSAIKVDGMRSAEAGHYSPRGLAKKGSSSSKTRAWAHDGDCEQHHDHAHEEEVWVNLQPPPTTITLGAMVGYVT